ncbi:MAG: IS1634 family transposase [Gammaproteobacteria bacterium]
MYVDVSTVRQGTKSYTRFLLRESFRENGKVKHRTIANLSQCAPQEIEAIQLALRHKANLSALQTMPPAIVLKQGPAFGAVYLLHEVARSLGIDQALGTTREGQLALWQVIARVLDQGSRLSAVRLATAHAAGEVLGVERFDEDALYANLDWLAAQQATIEERLFAQRTPSTPRGLFLYDVTSSYLEGKHNAFGAFGYNRDKKRGKPQVVIGLLCDGSGRPLSIEVFPGNTQDTKTFASQIDKVAQRFGGGEITFVGDRGMIKTPQIQALGVEKFHYITANTKPQIEALLKQGTLQMSLFDESVAEITPPEGDRYVLRRNPHRAQEIAASREDKYQTLLNAVAVSNAYLATRRRANPTLALEKLARRAQQLQIHPWVTLTLEQRTLRLEKNTQALAESAKLDGCYVLKTDLPPATASKELVHERYKDLALVEWAFRESKTVHLEMRPIYVRLESRTRGHALVVMLAYLLIHILAQRWRYLDLTVQEGLDQLATLCLTEVHTPNQPPAYQLPIPRDSIHQLLDAAHVRLPTKIAHRSTVVTTRTKLTQRRKSK